jgi:rSAM/selenodomain-associated transferase 1
LSCDRQLVVMARWPAPGRCKRRLAVGVGKARAAAVQARLTAHTFQVAAESRRLASQLGMPFELVLASEGLPARSAWRWAASLGADRIRPQGPGSLGLRMQRQMVRARREGARQVVLIGSDLPELAHGDLLAAFEALKRAPLVIGPASDGGYWLLGLRESCPPLFAGHGGPIPWGSAAVLATTLEAARACGLEATLLAERSDLDRPEDLRRWR